MLILRDVHEDGPGTSWRMFYMLLNGIIFILPAIQRPVTQETSCVVMTLGGRVIVKAGSSKL